MATVKEIRNALFEMQDVKYKEFQCKLIPTIAPDTVIGIRTPVLRKYAKTLMKDGAHEEFLKALPHRYFDENQLHAFLVSGIGEYDRCVEEVRLFLPFVDNWATCDQMSPKVFKTHKKELLKEIKLWIRSGEPYTVRFAIGMLMQHYQDDAFHMTCPEMVSKVKSEEYYVNMMIAWYFATALAKQYDSVLPYIETRRLDPWTHNKAIQKAVESYRIPDEHKTYLKSLRVKKGKWGIGVKA